MAQYFVSLLASLVILILLIVLINSVVKIERTKVSYSKNSKKNIGFPQNRFYWPYNSKYAPK